MSLAPRLFGYLRSGLLIGLLMSGLVQAQGPAAETPRFARISLTIENPTPTSLPDGRVWIYMPVARSGSQQLKRLEVKAPHQLLIDKLGNNIVQLDLGPVAPFSTRIVQLGAHALMYPEAALGKDADVAPYLGAERYIDAEAPDVVQLARNLKRESDRQTVEAIYQWVKGNLRYEGFTAADFGASHALQQRRGDCTEYAYLVAALARANGIPARVMGGYVSDRDFTPSAAEYHNWAEMYFEEAWHLVDAQRGSLFQNEESYLAFRIVSSREKNVLEGFHRFKASAGLVVRFN
jgi:transglutaminase-like putative cysteine protease